jgi:hypothetical protein
VYRSVCVEVFKAAAWCAASLAGTAAIIKATLELAYVLAVAVNIFDLG